MQLSLRGRACAAAAAFLSVLAVSAVVPTAPSAAQAGGPVADDGSPADTISVVKEEATPSNAEIAVRLSEVTPLPDTSTVLIGRDDEFADSLASGVLQATSPLLLVPSLGPVPERVRAELARLDPDRVILLGGDQAIAPAVAAELAGLGYAVERRAGDSRFETATAIAATDAAGADTAILARAFAAPGATDPTQGFADALAAGGLAAERGWPILLTQTEVLTASTRDHLVAAGITTVKLMGGTAAISEAVEAELVAMGIAAERIAGGSRAETAIEVAKERGAVTAADAAHVVLVQGQTADAWAGGFAAAAHAALLDAPIVLAVETQLPPATRDWLAGGATAGGGFAVDPSDGGAVLTCVTVPGLCEDARVTLGLPPATGVAFSPPPGSAVASSQPITATFAQPVGGPVSYGGTCLSQPGGVTVPGTTMQLGVDVDVPAGLCTFTLAYTPAGGAQQAVEVAYEHTGAPAIELLSLDGDGTAGGAGGPDASDDAQVVSFALFDVAGDGGWHAYAHTGGGREQLDVGAPPQTTAPETAVSGVGGRILFTSSDATLDPSAQAEGRATAYVRDLVAGTTRAVSRDAAGGWVDLPATLAISGDGGVVAYIGQGGTGGQDGAAAFLWLHDLATGEVEVVRSPDGAALSFSTAGAAPALSADGQLVAFQTAQPLLPVDDNATADAYLLDRATGQLELLSVAPDGSAGGAVDGNVHRQIGMSGDGRFVAFRYTAGDLVAGEDTGAFEVYLRDRVAGTTTRLTAGAGAIGSDAGTPHVSADGAWVAFSSDREVIPSTQQGCGVYRYEAATGRLDRVDLGATTGGNAGCPRRVAVATDGAVVFDHVNALHVGDDGGADVYRAAAPPAG